jgi:TPR repeat protein
VLHFLSSGINGQRNLFEAAPSHQNFVQLFFKESYCLFGLFLLHGTFIDKNEQEAVLYFKRSSDCYYSDGKLWLGICLIEGIGIQQNSTRGIELIQQLSEYKNLPSSPFMNQFE